MNKFALDDDVFNKGLRNIVSFSETCQRTGNIDYFKKYLVDDNDLEQVGHFGDFLGVKCSVKKVYFKNYVKITIRTKFSSYTIKVKYSFFDLDDVNLWAGYVAHKTDKKIKILNDQFYSDYNDILREKFRNLLSLTKIYKNETFSLYFTSYSVDIIKDDIIFRFEDIGWSDLEYFGAADIRLKTPGFAFLLSKVLESFREIDPFHMGLEDLGEISI